MTYTIPAPDAADFALTADGYTIPLGDAVDFEFPQQAGGGNGVYTIVPGVIASVGTPWRPNAAKKEAATTSRHRDAPRKPISRRLNARDASQEHRIAASFSHTDAPDKTISRSKPWGRSATQDAQRRARHENAEHRDGASRIAAWANASKRPDPFTRGLHENGTPRDLDPVQRWWETDRYREGVPGEILRWRPIGAYTSPVADILGNNIAPSRLQALGSFLVEEAKATLEARISPSDPIFTGRFDRPTPNNQSPSLPWGPGGRRDTTLDFEYPAYDGPVKVPGEPFDIPIRRLYVVSNSAQIVRVSDGRDIAAQAVTISTGIDSFSWTLQASLSGAAAIALVEGTDSEPVEVDVIVNDVTWRFVVDGWSLTEAARGEQGTIRGRSRSAYLAAPYAPTRDYQENSQLLAAQIAAQELPFGWNLQWDAGDWIVPSGAWAYQGQAPINAINKIAQAGGAYVQTDPETDLLIVKQRYPTAPWLWGAAAADFNLPRDLIIQRSSSKKPGQGKNGVYLHGSADGGILARVVRQGTAGDELIPTIVDALITDTVPARHRGVAALAATMRQSTEQHELPLSDSLGGLITPGNFVAVGTDPGAGFVRDWMGLVSGVTVTAQAARAGDKGVNLKVRQKLDIERHFED